MRTSRTTSILLNISFLILVAVMLSALTFAGDKNSAPASAPAPQQRQAAPQQRQAAPQQRQVRPTTPQVTNRGIAPNARVPSPTGSGGGISGRGLAGGRTGQVATSPAHYVARPGEQAKALPGGQTEFRNATGRAVTTNARGEVHRIEVPRGLAGGNKMVINRGPGGRRMVETGRPGARAVSYGPGRGFVERPLRPGYISRTYVVGGRSYAHVYREYSYHNVAYYHYVPAVYYGPRFYAWAATPWDAPMPYAWSGITAPWVGINAGYFTPYSSYASPDLWLTDYMIQENLRLSYENQRAGNPDQSQPAATPQTTAAALSPEMKAMIEGEIRQQLTDEKAAAAQPTPAGNSQPAPASDQRPAALKQKFFVVSTNLDINTTSGEACSLTPGDMIQRKGADVSSDGGIPIEVIASKPGGCPADSGATIQFAVLQEMSNQFREQLDAGLTILASHQMKSLPTGPDAGSHPVPEGVTDPIQGADTQLATQEADAARLEAQVRQEGGAN